MEATKYSIVIPIYNEEETFPELVKQASEVMDLLDGPSEVVLVDDGSRDSSYQLMVEASLRDPRFKVVQLSRNFGHQIAITAGMDATSGQAVIVMDADLQDPPHVILEMAAKWQEGYEVVQAVREQRDGETVFKKTTATLFYNVLKRIAEIEQPVDVGDFRLVDRQAPPRCGWHWRLDCCWPSLRSATAWWQSRSSWPACLMCLGTPHCWWPSPS